MLSLPALLIFGLPPHLALGTFSLGSFGYNIGGIVQYIKKEKVVWKFVLPLSIIAVVAGFAGSMTIITVNEEILTKFIGGFLLFLIPIIILKPDLGIATKNVSTLSLLMGYGAFALASFYGASIVTGQGIFIVYAVMYFFGLPMLLLLQKYRP